MKKIMSLFVGVFMMCSGFNVILCGGGQSTPSGGGGSFGGGGASGDF